MKKTSARHRISLLTLLMVVFAQLSLSAYACAMAPTDDVVQSMVIVAADTDCHGQSAAVMVDVQCGFHCQDSSAVPSSALQDLTPDQSALPLTIDLPLVSQPEALSWQREAVLAMTTAPPVSLRFCRFLI